MSVVTLTKSVVALFLQSPVGSFALDSQGDRELGYELSQIYFAGESHPLHKLLSTDSLRYLTPPAREFFFEALHSGMVIRHPQGPEYYLYGEDAQGNFLAGHEALGGTVTLQTVSMNPVTKWLEFSDGYQVQL